MSSISGGICEENGDLLENDEWCIQLHTRRVFDWKRNILSLLWLEYSFRVKGLSLLP